MLWLLAGLGQSLAEIPSETLIGENISSENQGKVYGSHFAFSHLWWAIAYPIARFMSTSFPENDCLFVGILKVKLTLLAFFISVNFQNHELDNKRKTQNR